MKKIFLLLIIISLFGHTSAQFNNNNAAGTAQTMWGQVGAIFGGYGVQIKNYFADTSAANASSIGGTTGFLKNIPGIIIRTADDSYWARSRDLQKWNKINAGTGTIPTWQQTLTAGSTLTGANTIAGGGFNFTWNNLGILTLNGNVSLPATSSSSTGVILKGSNRFIHDFKLAGTDGDNLFVGGLAGNFTMTGSSGIQGSYNLGIGNATLNGNTTGFSNTAVGIYALQQNTTGFSNTAVGQAALLVNATGFNNTAIGTRALTFNGNGTSNSAHGVDALFANTSGSFNTAICIDALYQNTTGSYNVGVGDSTFWIGTVGIKNTAIGSRAGYYLGDTYPNFGTVKDSMITLIGADASRDSSISNTTALKNMTVIGYNAKGFASNQVVLGNNDVTSTLFKGLMNNRNYGSGTNTGTPTYALQVNSSGDIIEGSLTTGLTVGTTTITSGTTTSILYDNAGVLGEYTLSGTGTVVAMATSPDITTSITTPSTTFSIANTTATTGNLFGAATTMTIGGTPTTAITHNYSTNATAAATTKTINLGTGGAASSTTNINIGSANGGTTTVNSPTLAATIFNASTGFRIGGAATSRKMLVGNGTNFVASTETWAVPGTSGNVLTSDGTNWISAAPAGGMAIGGSITSATQGSVLFAGASGVLAQDNSNLFWDNTNKRLAIGSTTTTFDIDVRKTTDGSVGFGVQNASGGTSAAAVFQLGRSYGADYYVSHYYAGDGNTVYTPLSYNIINASGSTGGMNLVNIANASMTFGTSNTTRMTISGAGAVRMHTYGAGAATFDASGNITSVSDIRLKNIQGYYGVGLKQLMQINPIVYKWKPSSGMETKHDYIGFSAQNIRSSLGEDAIGINKQGYLSIQDRAILAVAINAIQELKELNDKQQKEIDNLKQIIKNK